ncbi:hypothetical protein J2S09_004110 [Bacillus fengqiuensis]|nr:hypothetical protein [Bacillus fengqiuensis]
MTTNLNLVNISRALFKDREINENRGRYIINLLDGDSGEVMFQGLDEKYGYFLVPRSVFT